MPVLLRENIYRERKLPRADEILQLRSKFLLPIDKALIEGILIKGQSAISIAQIMKISAKAVRLRIHRLSKRLTSRKFLDTARALPYLKSADARVAKMKFCQGLTNREICQKEKLTPYKLRRVLDRLAAEISFIKRMKKSHTPEVLSPEYFDV